MASLVLTAVGTAIGGPLGGALGALVGSRIDGALFGPPDREGPRLTELKVTTSSYGAPLARHFGTMRAAGTIIWATDLKESAEKSGGGKGRPSTTTYSYSSSFAVALASRKIERVGRIWADGNLLRGAAGDLKVQGALRVYTGTGDQLPDPLIASAEGSECPAFRGLAYCVFENLQLADFGNRIPALTFEIVADDGQVSLAELVSPAQPAGEVGRTLDDLEGYSDEGGALADTLATIDRAYPLASDAGAAGLSISSGDPVGNPVLVLPAPVVDRQGDGFGGLSGKRERARPDAAGVPAGLRYYDIDRDYQAGLQRASGRASPERNRIIDFPGALQAASAKRLADAAAERAGWARDRLAYRIAEIDPSLSPGQIVSVPGQPGKWRVEAWEWRETGLELDLQRLPQRHGTAAAAAPGRVLGSVDIVATPTVLEAYELPWDGNGSSDTRQVFAAASSTSQGWTGAALYGENNGALFPIGATGSRRSVVGTTLGALRPAASVLIDRESDIEVQLMSTDFVLDSVDLAALAQGANRALVGEEIVQFATAQSLGEGRWRLSGLLRGRGGTEHFALVGSPQGSGFVMLDARPVALDVNELGTATAVAAIGLSDEEPVVDAISGLGSSLRPPCPVHPKAREEDDGSLALAWTRRARGTWAWSGTVEVPMVEQAEAYEVGLGDPDAPDVMWQVSEPALVIASADLGALRSDHGGKALWVRQIGTHARSLPLLMTTIN
ncbi:phage tail protein [Aurantiacibacter luteus]|uniref:Uncharacterized protein n=1 Tax=Aurantiacibacter luteus TaxID=1581420 RepID=A0A0G9MUQ8_9SPHN|nr:phage tail protein [Aurantiacibacter luteus]KLE34456.1 hypothetical protein AAW00_09550 [Aurantiacibacter luteus]